MKVVALILISSLLFHHRYSEKVDGKGLKIADGQMPYVATDSRGNIHVVYGRADSILYSSSTDNGKKFSKPVLVSLLSGLAASHTRGPQIAVTTDGVVITACSSDGNIFSYSSDKSGHWKKGPRINDVDTVAKENFMALAADGNNAFVVWLDLRNKHNQIWGARSVDGGKSWSKNVLVYASPDETVCECCKPSAAITGNHIYVMFRNWLKGNRDLYLIQSTNNGKSFEQAQKLGTGSWRINACPMDGGGLAIANNGDVVTVWNREGSIYSCKPGTPEARLGSGRNCTIESINNKEVYAWVEDKSVTVLMPGHKVNLGKGSSPILKAINSHQILCAWENEKQIYTAVLDL
jgi:hypothetical protein